MKVEEPLAQFATHEETTALRNCSLDGEGQLGQWCLAYVEYECAKRQTRQMFRSAEERVELMGNSRIRETP